MTVRRITRWAAVALAAVSIGTAGMAAAAGQGSSAEQFARKHEKFCHEPPTKYREEHCPPFGHHHHHDGHGD